MNSTHINFLDHSAITTDTPGRVPKANVISALQSSGETYDRVRETLKAVSVDASGKVEVEDWVEVSFHVLLTRAHDEGTDHRLSFFVTTPRPYHYQSSTQSSEHTRVI